MVIYSSSDRLCDFWDNREQQEGDRGAAEGRDGRRRGGVHHPQWLPTAQGKMKLFYNLIDVKEEDIFESRRGGKENNNNNNTVSMSSLNELYGKTITSLLCFVIKKGHFLPVVCHIFVFVSQIQPLHSVILDRTDDKLQPCLKIAPFNKYRLVCAC